MTRWATIGVLSFCVVACDGGTDDVGDPGVTFVEPGTGEPSSGDLWPLGSGTRRVFEVGGRAITGGLGPSHRGTGQRYLGAADIRFLARTDAGLLYAETARIGRLARPILLLPPSLRDGMVWQVHGTEGAVLGTFTVEQRVESSIFGPDLPTWRVTQRNEITGSEFTTDYVEGFGAIATESAHIAEAVIPLAPPERAPWPTTGVEPMNDGDVIHEDLYVRHIELVESAEGATLRVSGFVASSRTGGGVVSWRYEPAAVCIGLSDRLGSPIDEAETEPCPTAFGGLVDASGAYQPFPPPGPDAISTPFLGADGAPAAIAYGSDPFGETTWGRTDDRWGGTGALMTPWSELGAVERVLTGPLQLGADGDVGFVVQIEDRLLHGRSTGPSLDGSLRLAGSIPGGSVSARLDVEGRDYLVTTVDGVVDRLRIDADGATLERVAVLAIPEGHELVGAAPHAGGLLALTLAGREDLPTISRSSAPPYLGALYAWTASIEPPPSTEGLDRPSPPEQSLVAWPVHDGLRICAADGLTLPLDGWTLGGAPAAAHRSGACVVLEGAIDPSSPWAYRAEGTIDGVGPVVLAQLPPRDPPPMRFDRHAIAPLSDGGFMSYSFLYDDHLDPLSVPARAASPQQNWIAGGVADSGGHGIWRLPNALIADESCPDPERPCLPIQRWGPDGYVSAPVVGGTSTSLFGHIAGGGVLLRGSGGVTAVAPDGTLTPLEPPDLPGTTGWIGARADGTVCGVRAVPTGGLGSYDRFLLCRDPSGAITELSEAEEPLVLQLGSGSPLLPDDDGTFYGIFGTRLTRVDPSGPTVTVVDLTATGVDDVSLQERWSPTGELHFVGVAPSGPSFVRRLFEVVDGALVELPLPEEVLALEETVEILVGARTFVARGASVRHVWPRR